MNGAATDPTPGSLDLNSRAKMKSSSRDGNHRRLLRPCRDDTVCSLPHGSKLVCINANRTLPTAAPRHAPGHHQFHGARPVEQSRPRNLDGNLLVDQSANQIVATEKNPLTGDVDRRANVVFALSLEATLNVQNERISKRTPPLGSYWFFSGHLAPPQDDVV